MRLIERIIREETTRTVVITVQRMTAGIVEEIVTKLLNDPKRRADYTRLIDDALMHALADLDLEEEHPTAREQ